MFARVSVHEGHRLRDVSPAPLVEIEGYHGSLMLIDRETGKGLGIVLFDTEENMRRGDEYINSMPTGTAGEVSSTEVYEVVVSDFRATT
jgi:hypothetical protein